MKTTFKSNEIAHIWMHQSAPYGKSTSALSFNGPAISSYSTEIARLIEHNGKKAVIINDRSFSILTSKHQGQMRHALLPESELPRFYVSTGQGGSLRHSGREIYEYAIGQATYAKGNAEKTRPSMKKDGFLASQAMWLERAKAISTFFGLRKKVDEKAIARLATAKAREEKRQAKAAKEREEKQRIEYTANFEAWKAGSEKFEYFPTNLFPVAFRIEGDEVVSSKGARVTLKEARIAIRFATSKRGMEWRENGETCLVGNYRLNAINAQGVVAGCHRITWEEIDRIASILA